METPTARGSYFARNRAIAVSRGRFLAFTDRGNDLPETWLETGLRYLAEHRMDYVAGREVGKR